MFNKPPTAGLEKKIISITKNANINNNNTNF